MITIVFPYYNNAGMLREQWRTWCSYSAQTKSMVNVIVVDDSSPWAPAADALSRREWLSSGLASLRLYRAGVDIRWNWLFCRNLGATEAKTEWLLLTDIDHVIPQDTLYSLLEHPHDRKRVYRFCRVSMPELKLYHPHADTFFMTRDMFWKIGGYDERFSGYYGSSSDIRHRMKAMGVVIELLPHSIIRYPREVIPDASTPREINGRPTRKLPEDDAGLARVRAEIAALPKHQRKPVTLNIPWDRLI